MKLENSFPSGVSSRFAIDPRVAALQIALVPQGLLTNNRTSKMRSLWMSNARGTTLSARLPLNVRRWFYLADRTTAFGMVRARPCDFPFAAGAAVSSSRSVCSCGFCGRQLPSPQATQKKHRRKLTVKESARKWMLRLSLGEMVFE